MSAAAGGVRLPMREPPVQGECSLPRPAPGEFWQSTRPLVPCPPGGRQNRRGTGESGAMLGVGPSRAKWEGWGMPQLRLMAEGPGGGHGGEVFALAFTPDARFVLSGGWDGHLRL